jgi:hypothetical protein
MRRQLTMTGLLLLSAALGAQEAQPPELEQAATEQSIARTEPAAPDQPRTMSGMSILGNEEAPKSLVIVPWKGSELGEDLNLTDTLDQRARPVDKDVFMRELDYYAIRSGEAGQP